MLIYDSHCHLEYVSQVLEHNIPAIIPATNLSQAQQLYELRDKHPIYKIGFGIHPWHIDPLATLDEVKTELCALITQYKPDFIGEIGIDALKPDIERQKEYFALQLQIAKQFDLPVVIHCVQAYNDIIPIIRKCKIKKGVVHAFNANHLIAKQLTDWGLHLGIGSMIGKNAKISNSITAIPLSKFMLESDAPYMPALHKTSSQPTDVFLHAQLVANKYQLNLVDIIRQSNNNITDLFGIYS